MTRARFGPSQIDGVHLPGPEHTVGLHQSRQTVNVARHVDADEQRADDLGSVLQRHALGHVRLVEERDRTNEGLARPQQPRGRMLAIEPGAHGAGAVLLLQRCRDKLEVIARAHKHRCDAAGGQREGIDLGGRSVDRIATEQQDRAPTRSLPPCAESDQRC
jgi:hypothetical protein